MLTIMFLKNILRTFGAEILKLFKPEHSASAQKLEVLYKKGALERIKQKFAIIILYYFAALVGNMFFVLAWNSSLLETFD